MDAPAHHHDHSPAAPASRVTRLVLAALLAPFVLFTVVGLVLLAPGEQPGPGPADGVRLTGEVVALAATPCSADEVAPGAGRCAALTVRVDDGPLAGRTVTVLDRGAGGADSPGLGDGVVLLAAGDPADPAAYQVLDVRRGTPLTALAVLFAVAVVVLGRWRGVSALAGLGVTAAVLLLFVLPAVLAGHDPFVVAVVGCFATTLTALYLTHGFSARTSTAVLGTLGSLVVIALLGTAFAQLSRLGGAGEELAILTSRLGFAVDGRSLLLAGLVIGALGALDDVTVTQTSVVWELRAADPALPARELFSSAMRVGRDHVASAVNTLVLAYAGTTLPLLLLFSVLERGLTDALTTQVVATEVVRTLVGSLGLVASVPLTTALAVAVVVRPGSVRTATRG